MKECYMFKKDGRCKYGESCRYRHVKRDKPKVTSPPDVICPLFIGKEGCKGGCNKAHAFKEDIELLEIYDSGIDIINIHVNEIEKLKLQMKMALQLTEKDMYDLPTPTPSDTQSEPEYNNKNQYIAPALTFDSFLAHNDNSRYKHEARASVQPASSTSTDQPNFEALKKPTPASEFAGDQYSREVQQVERLFRGRCQVLERDNGTMFQAIMKPTDPDWSYTLLELNFDIFIPCEYPNGTSTIEFCDERVSEMTLNIINSTIQHEIEERRGSMCIRPMLRWIDRNIGEMLQPESQLLKYSNLKVHRKGDDHDTSDSESDDYDEECPPQPPAPVVMDGDSSVDFLDKEVGTSARLTDLNLHNSSHGLIPKFLMYVLQCLRCKIQVELEISPGETKTVVCSRCSCELSCKLYKKLCLPSSSSIACVDLVGCSAADLILSRSRITTICTECSQSSLLSLQAGSPNHCWCASCSQKMTISYESVKLVVLTPPLLSGKQARRTKVDKGYVEGQPLPERGVCKHYRKSQRWFRFTCCGRLYPCDKCHDHDVPDCPLEHANRMVCGHCAREQAVRSQCKFCKGEVAGGVKSVHWEGGKGCRDKVRMSNNDSRKHKNSKNKTQSQKDKRVGKKEKKKGTE